MITLELKSQVDKIWEAFWTAGISNLLLTLLFLSVTFVGCENKYSSIEITANDFHDAQDQLTSVIVHDIFSPPVASRVYVYSNIAAHEILAQDQQNNYKSLKGMLRDFKGISKSKDTLVNHKLAALIAFLKVGKTLIFSQQLIAEYEEQLFSKWEKINPKVYLASKVYAEKVSDEIRLWYKSDNYNESRTYPKFTVDYDSPSRWKPTPPDYMDGIEPHWSKIRPFVIESAAQFQPEPPPAFSMDPDSEFYKELHEVYKIIKEIQNNENEDERKDIAKFWDCNPYVSTHKGHVMFALKKISPGAHWIGITKIVSRNLNADIYKTVAAYAKTSVAIADAFISCWDEKYRSNLIRPETLINQTIDENWYPVLQTPPFPEYTSGHSVVSGAASVALTDFFGDNISFEDDTELVYDLPIRIFKSFNHAAEEAAISRLYGGIHYRKAIVEGLKQGKELGSFVSKKLAIEPN